MTDENRIPDKVEIRHNHDPLLGGPSQVWVTFGREEMQAFFYYPDEIQFSKEELEGLTLKEMRELRHKKDVEYLGS